jgi:molybdopterin/thiamine biosynthesis adenylyltransferase
MTPAGELTPASDRRHGHKGAISQVSLDFSDEETRRYLRNSRLAEVGWPGQRRWRAGRVLVVGAGGIGSACLLYLAAAGVGQIGIADGDAVELSNLQRQILYRVADLGRRKVEAAKEALLALNPQVQVQTYDTRLEAANLPEVLQDYHLVLDASDNFPTRFLVADYCWEGKIPLISAAATGFLGQLLAVIPGQGHPCYRCLLPEPPVAEAVPSSRQAGILGAVAGVMGTLQAAEALKLLLGRDTELARRFLAYDGLSCRFSFITRIKRPGCPGCGPSPAS